MYIVWSHGLRYSSYFDTRNRSLKSIHYDIGISTCNDQLLTSNIDSIFLSFRSTAPDPPAPDQSRHNIEEAVRETRLMGRISTGWIAGGKKRRQGTACRSCGVRSKRNGEIKTKVNNLLNTSLIAGQVLPGHALPAPPIPAWRPTCRPCRRSDI